MSLYARGPAQPNHPPNGPDARPRDYPDQRAWPVLPALPDPQLTCGRWWCVKGGEAIATEERRDAGAPLTRRHRPLRRLRDRVKQSGLLATSAVLHRSVALPRSSDCGDGRPGSRQSRKDWTATRSEASQTPWYQWVAHEVFGSMPRPSDPRRWVGGQFGQALMRWCRRLGWWVEPRRPRCVGSACAHTRDPGTDWMPRRDLSSLRTRLRPRCPAPPRN